MNAIDNLLSRLDQVTNTGRVQWKALCPAHTDRSPSLAIKCGDDNRVLVKCWAGCEALDIVQAVGLTLADLFEQDREYLPASKYRQLGAKVKPTIRPNWREIIQLVFHDCTVIALCADRIEKQGALSVDDMDCLKTSHQSLCKVIDTTEALEMPKGRKAA